MMSTEQMYELLAHMIIEERRRESQRPHLENHRPGNETGAGRWRSRLARFFMGVSLRLDQGAALGSPQARNHGV